MPYRKRHHHIKLVDDWYTAIADDLGTWTIYYERLSPSQALQQGVIKIGEARWLDDAYGLEDRIPNVRIDEEVWQEICMRLEADIAADCQGLLDEVDEHHEEIHEIGAPTPSYVPTLTGGVVETLDSALSSTEFVLAAGRDDAVLMLARILENQRTILYTLNRLGLDT